MAIFLQAYSDGGFTQVYVLQVNVLKGPPHVSLNAYFFFHTQLKSETLFKDM